MPSDHPDRTAGTGSEAAWSRTSHGVVLPLTAAGLALSYLVAAWTSLGVAAVAVAAIAGAGSVVLVHRRSPRLRAALGAVALWLALAMSVAFALGGRPILGLAAVGVGLFAGPLLLVPWLYARTFDDHDADAPRPARPGPAQGDRP